MVIAADYPFLDLFFSMILFFLWVSWFWMVISILSDVFGRRDISGGKKALWSVFIIALPFVGALSYVVVAGDAMAERKLPQSRAAQETPRGDARSGGVPDGDPAGQIATAFQLLDSGAISEAEFGALKAKALA